MAIKIDEISALIKEQIKKYTEDLQTTTVGTVIRVGDGIAIVYGLDDAMNGELLDFGNDVYGMALNLEENQVGAIIFGNANLVKEGDTVKCTKRILEVPVGDSLLGRVVNPIGQPLDGLGEIKTRTYRPIEKKATGVMARKSVNQPLQTGIKVIDALVPIGRGQRELIIGDRQTGKTSIAIDTIINQKGKDVICVYVAIGQKESTVNNVIETLKKYDCMNYSIVVSASASNMAPLLYLAPYAGVTIAEEFMFAGKDVLIIYDDLSLELGRIRFRPEGSDGGHNGIKSIIKHLGTKNVARLKIGIGPQPNLPSEVFVLQNFTKEELEQLKTTLSKAKDGIECYFKDGITVAQNKFN